MIVFFHIKMRYIAGVENIFLPSSSTPVVNPFPLVIVATGVCCIICMFILVKIHYMGFAKK